MKSTIGLSKMMVSIRARINYGLALLILTNLGGLQPISTVSAAAASSSSATAAVNPISHQSFADTLTSQLYTNDNECSSALGISMAFSLIYPGCTGQEAINQMQSVFGYNIDMQQKQLVWEETTNRLLEHAAGQCGTGGEWNGVCNSEAPLLKIANSIWYDTTNSLNANYEQVVGGSNYAKQIDLSSNDSPLLVNQWVKEQTNELIQSIVDESRPLYPPHELIAINSIYLKASWKHPFHEHKTNLDSFYSSGARENVVSEAHFMNGVFNNNNKLAYSHEALPGYQVVQLPFAESQMSMIFVLPIAKTESAASLVVTSTELLRALPNLQMTHRVALSIPKFKFESTYEDNLKETLESMGLTAPFTGGGSLCGLFQNNNTTNCNSLLIDKVIQKTVIDVHEVGMEAAAVTAIMTGRSSVMQSSMDDPILMVCDHPFQFFIYDAVEGLVLFEGRVGKPEVPLSAGGIDPSVQQPLLLEGVHSENDFWFKSFGANPVDPPPYSIATAVTNEKPAEDAPSPLGSSGPFTMKKCFTLVVGLILRFALGLLL